MDEMKFHSWTILLIFFSCRSVFVHGKPKAGSAGCIDKNKWCHSWSQRGECVMNPNYMNYYCRKSCKICTILIKTTPLPHQQKQLPGCQDKNRYCSYWKRNYQCSLSRSYMTTYCPKSCGLCGFAATTKAAYSASVSQPKTTTPYPTTNRINVTLTSRNLKTTAGQVIECGKRALLGRIVGGKKSPPGSWPWQVGIKSCAKCKFFCGGTIVGKKWIVTAAHCVSGLYQPHELFIEAGVVSQGAVSNQRPQAFKGKEIHVHQEYNVNAPYDQDIAVLKLDHEITYNDYIRPLCVSDRGLNVKQHCVATGFGQTKEQGLKSIYLREASVPIVSRKTCAKAYLSAVPAQQITSNMLCAGFARGGIDACGGDSGGPLNCYDVQKQTYFLGGIVSWGVGCARVNRYGVYTDVQHVVAWLKNITKIV